MVEGHDKVFDIIFNKDEVTWQSMIYDLVREEEMDPWDIDVSRLAMRYIEMLRQLKKMDFSISGKVVLAAAILLKMKSTRLVGEDINYLDSLFAQKDEVELEDGFDDIPENMLLQREEEQPRLIPRTPQPRKRKVSVYDLIEALQKAMEVKNRRVTRHLPKDLEIEVPKRKFDISQVIREVYSKIRSYFFNNKSGLTFTKLLPDQPSKEDKVYTFIPLLHLTNQRKIDLHQEEHFGEIDIELKYKS